MSLSLMVSENYRTVMDKLYERHNEIKKDHKIKPYYQKTLANALNKSQQALSEILNFLTVVGAIEKKSDSGPKKGQVNYLHLTDEGLTAWMVLTPPAVDEVKDLIIEYKKHCRNFVAEDIAIELGRNPKDQNVMNIIYAVMAIPDVKNYDGPKIIDA